MTAKVLFTGKTHTTAGANGASRSADGFLDIKLPQPHPAAENLFGAAWSACYLGRDPTGRRPAQDRPDRSFGRRRDRPGQRSRRLFPASPPRRQPAGH